MSVSLTVVGPVSSSFFSQFEVITYLPKWTMTIKSDEVRVKKCQANWYIFSKIVVVGLKVLHAFLELFHAWFLKMAAFSFDVRWRPHTHSSTSVVDHLIKEWMIEAVPWTMAIVHVYPFLNGFSWQYLFNLFSLFVVGISSLKSFKFTWKRKKRTTNSYLNK